MVVRIFKKDGKLRAHFFFSQSPLRKTLTPNLIDLNFKGVFLDENEDELYLTLRDLNNLVSLNVLMQVIKLKRIELVEDEEEDLLIKEKDVFDLLATLWNTSPEARAAFQIYLDEVYLPLRIGKLENCTEAYDEVKERFLKKLN